MIRINLAPGRPRGRAGGLALALPSFNLGLLFGVLYLAALGGMGWYWMKLASDETRLRTEVAQATTLLTTLKARVGQESQVKAMLPELQKRVDAITELTKNQSRPVRLFDAFADTLPRDLWITGLEDRNGVLKILGISFSPTAVSDFMTNLRGSGKFKDIDILVSRQELQKTPRLVTFEVTCRFES
jgi:Tfp pilus assembly protein PilN